MNRIVVWCLFIAVLLVTSLTAIFVDFPGQWGVVILCFLLVLVTFDALTQCTRLRRPRYNP